MSFSPTGISTLYAWYVADNIGTTSGNVVNFWQDSSGSGNNATPQASSNAPTYIPNAINGHAAVLFSSGQYLQVASNASLGIDASNNTTFVVFNSLNANMRQAIYSVFQGNGVQVSTIGLNDNSGTQFFHVANDNPAVIETQANVFQSNVWTERQDNINSANGYGTIFQNGNIITSGNAVVAGVAATPVLQIGRNNTSGPPNVITFYSGYIAEIVAYGKSLTSTEYTQVDNYLTQKYSLFSPTGIYGCSFWYIADGLTTSGNYVTYWKDLSGSGVNLTYPTTPGSSTTVFPVYIPNVLNGYGAVRFSGGQYLTNNSATRALATSTGCLTTFSVYAVTGLKQQVVYSVDQGTLSTAVGGIIGTDVTGTGMLFAYNGIVANALVASAVYNPNKYILRHDRFDPLLGTFYIGYFGVDIFSGSTPLNNLISNDLNIGYAPQANYSNKMLQGDVVEIVGYNLPLATTDVSKVNNYLINKYFPSSPSPTPTPTPTPTPPPPTINYTIPSDLSGLCAWFRSTSIGIVGVDGSPVQYWPDDSGSGNNLSVSSTSSGTWVFPTFYRNQINGYPTVRFINGNGYSYLAGGFSSSLNFSQNDLTTFCVFKTIDNTTPQCVFGVDDSFHYNVFDVGLNTQANNSFSFGNGYYTSYNELTASSTTFGTSLYSTNQFTIRSDRFRPQDGYLYFGRYGAELASGVTSTYATTNRMFRMGYCSAQGNAFYGDIAEIIAYRRKLSDIEVEEINEYLLQKYMPGNVGATTLFINATTNSGIYKDFPLYVMGGRSGVLSSTTLYTGSKSLVNSGTTLYTNGGKNSLTNSIILYTESNRFNSNNISLYTSGYIGSANANIPLYVGASSIVSRNITLYTSGSTYSTNTNIALYIGASSVISRNLTLYTNASTSTNSGISLYTAASQQQFPPITLYTYGLSNTPAQNTTQLYVKGYTYPTSTGHIPLFLYTNTTSSNASGLYNTRPLYLEAGNIYQSMPLYIATFPAPPVNTNPSGSMPLFIGDAYATGYLNTYFSLYIANNVNSITSTVKRLYTKGAGGLQDGYSINSNLLPLYLFNNGVNPPTPPASSTAQPSEAYWYNYYSDPSYFQTDYFDVLGFSGTIQSVLNTSNGMSLFIGASTVANSSVSLYQRGSTTISGGIISMYTTGRDLALTNSDTLYIRGF